jgi:hypothetical protein
MKEPLIKVNRVFKYSITFQETNDESREVSDFSDSGFIIENETDEIGDILKLAQQTYGIYYPIAFGVWESTTPEHNAKYFEKGIETYYGLFIKNEDGTDITEEEYDFITFLLSDGNYNKSQFTDYAVGGVVLGALALGVGGLIGYYYFKNKKSSKKDSVDSRAKFVIHKINGKDRKFPIKDAWTKEHYHDNEDEDYEVEPSKRKVPARNRKFVNGGGVDEVKYFYIKGRNEDAPQKLKDTYSEFYTENDLIEYLNKWKGIKNVSFNSITKVYNNGESKDVTDFYLKNTYSKGKYSNGGTTTTRPTTTPEVVPDTDTKPPRPKTPFQPKHIPKPKARKYDFILIKK